MRAPRNEMNAKLQKKDENDNEIDDNIPATQRDNDFFLASYAIGAL